MLTPRQQRFVDEYLIDLDGSKAAVRAGYSKKTANRIAYENLRKPAIAEAVAKAQAERAQRTQVDADWVLRRLRDELQADLLDLYDSAGNLRPVAEWPLIWRQGLVGGLEVESLVIKQKRHGTVSKLKLSDRVKRLELIGRHVNVQAFAERKEIGGIGGGPLEVKDLSMTEIARRIAFVLAKAAED